MARSHGDGEVRGGPGVFHGGGDRVLVSREQVRPLRQGDDGLFNGSANRRAILHDGIHSPAHFGLQFAQRGIGLRLRFVVGVQLAPALLLSSKLIGGAEKDSRGGVRQDFAQKLPGKCAVLRRELATQVQPAQVAGGRQAGVRVAGLVTDLLQPSVVAILAQLVRQHVKRDERGRGPREPVGGEHADVHAMRREPGGGADFRVPGDGDLRLTPVAGWFDLHASRITLQQRPAEFERVPGKCRRNGARSRSSRAGRRRRGRSGRRRRVCRRVFRC